MRQPNTPNEHPRPERFYVSIAVAVVSACALLLAVFVQYEWPWYLWVLGSLSLIGGGMGIWVSQGEVSRRVFKVASAVAFCVSGLVGVGGATQLVIDGKPVAATSDQARAHNTVRDIYGDILRMGRLDELLVISQPDARARYNDYEPAARELRKISNRWSRVDLGELPDPDLIEIIQHVKSGATAGAAAIEIRYQIIIEPDTRAEAIMKENRGAFLAETLAAGAKLRPLAERYKVELVGGGLE